MEEELGFEHEHHLRRRFRAGDVSPGDDSIIIFSVDSHHLAGYEYSETFSGPELNPNKSAGHKNSHLSRKEKEKVHRQDNNVDEIEDASLALDSARNSFSIAIKECQDRRAARSEALSKKADLRNPLLLDLNKSISNAKSSSPPFGVMKKSFVTTHRTGTLPSPGTPNYGLQKGCSLERVPLHTNSNRKHVGSVLPFNNGRTLPSKWEDAERWIFSPVSGDGVMRHSFPQPQRRPKSKSGPLRPHEIAYYSLFSPVVPMLEGGKVGNLIGNSPFSDGVMAADGLTIRRGGGPEVAGNFAARIEHCMARSVSVHGCSEMLGQSSLPGSEDEKLDDRKDAATSISCVVSRRDMATQMSPQSSPHSSLGRQSSFSPSTPSMLPIVELPTVHSSKPEVRDVQVDERVTVTRWSKKHRARIPGRFSENIGEWKRKAMDVQSAGWEVSETAKAISKVKTEEARISAWENLQKAKAEAAMRKLEMKLEKKRSSSMDKIVNKLRSAQKKAQDMRSSVLANQSHQVARTSNKAITFGQTRRMGSLSGCFTCHAL